MRIAVSGAQGSGKSSLANDLLAKFQQNSSDCVLLEGIGSKAAALGVPLGENADLETACVFARLHLEREQAALSCVVFDRCLLDLYAYVVVLQIGPAAFREFVRTLTSVSLAAMDLVAITKIPHSQWNTGDVREKDAFRLAFDAQLPAIAAGIGCRYVVIDGNRGERVDRILEALSGKLRA